MANKVAHDGAKLNEILKLQNKIANIVLSYPNKEDLLEEENSNDFDRLYFNLLRVIKVGETLSTKLKKEKLAFHNKFRNNLIVQNLGECYPMISKKEIIKYAEDVSQGYTIDRVKEFYTLTIN